MKHKQAQQTHYEVLGVSRSFTAEELKAAWQQRARSTHPDRVVSDEFPAVSQAYAVLRDPKRRASYDAELDLFTEPCSKCKGTGVVYKQKGFVGRVAGKCEACRGTGRHNG
jgi:DnaJ-class molecular chaperone